jgi:molybdopterin converting factor small subunit
MRVTMTFLGLLRDHIGAPSLAVELPAGSTYRDLLEALAPTLEAKLPTWTWDAPKRSFSQRVTVSRNLNADLREETTCLTDGDEILVLLPMAGG